MVFVGQLMVALCFAELAARYPVAGSVYNWSKKLGGPHVGWLGGWMMLTATSVVTISAVALGLPDHAAADLVERFQFIGDGTGTTIAANNAVLLGACPDRVHHAR